MTVFFNVFTDWALWAKSVRESTCLCVCVSVCLMSIPHAFFFKVIKSYAVCHMSHVTCFFVFFYKVVKLVGVGSVINGGPIQFLMKAMLKYIQYYLLTDLMLPYFFLSFHFMFFLALLGSGATICTRPEIQFLPFGCDC